MANMRTWAYCRTCQVKHMAAVGSDEVAEFYARHAGHDVGTGEASALLDKLHRITGADLFKLIKRVSSDELILDMDRLGIAGYTSNANVKQAFGIATNFTKTNANIASSPTAGWKANAIDNTSNLFNDAQVSPIYAAVNTAPGDSKTIFIYANGLVDDTGTAYTSTGDGTPDGSEGTITFPDVTTLVPVCPLLGAVPYPVQNKAINAGPYMVARCFDGVLPSKWLISAVNHSGMTLSVTNYTYRGVYWTVV